MSVCECVGLCELKDVMPAYFVVVDFVAQLLIMQLRSTGISRSGMFRV